MQNCRQRNRNWLNYLGIAAWYNLLLGTSDVLWWMKWRKTFFLCIFGLTSLLHEWFTSGKSRRQLPTYLMRNCQLHCKGVLGQQCVAWTGLQHFVVISPLRPSDHYTCMYRQSNIQQFYVLPTQCVYVWIWEQTAIISLYSIDWLVFITETECVYCAVRSTFYVLPT